MKTTVKRTRRHVVIRLTPAQAIAMARHHAGLPVPARALNQLVGIGKEAAEAANQEPPAKPNPTSFGNPRRRAADV